MNTQLGFGSTTTYTPQLHNIIQYERHKNNIHMTHKPHESYSRQRPHKKIEDYKHMPQHIPQGSNLRKTTMDPKMMHVSNETPSIQKKLITPRHISTEIMDELEVAPPTINYHHAHILTKKPPTRP